MKRRATKRLFLFLVSIVSFLLIGTFIVSDFTSGYVSAVSGNGGAIYVGSNSKYNMSSNSVKPISFNTATNGGGIYIEDGGIVTIRNGRIYGNTATSGNGHDIYNAGTFTFGGSSATLGTSVKCKRYDSEENESLTGEYVYFGSYPQTIKDESVTIDTSDIDSNGYYLGSDGERYAMVSSPTPFDSEYTFSDGTAISSEETYYFKVEPLKWRILSDENGRVLLFCENIINAYHYYNSTKTRTIGRTINPNNYKYSDIRSWLNGNAKERGNTAGENWEGIGFLQNAFSTEEQKFIFTTTVDNSDESTLYLGNEFACQDTKDKVFLLSNSELTNTDYGFTSNTSTFNQLRRKSTTDFALVNGAYYDTTTGTKKVGRWWTRSPYWDNVRIVFTVDSAGEINCDYETIATLDQFGIVPAITISSSILEREGYEIYNTGTMNIYGGIIYDDIYSETSFNTRVSAYILGTITLSDSATITVENYDGLELDYDIIISDTRENGTILILQGNETAPDLSGFNITGYDTTKQRIISSQNEDGDWEVKLAYKQVQVRLSKGTGIESVSGAGVYDYGTTVTVSATPSPGYHWKNWTYRSSSVVKSTSQNYTFTVGTTPVVLKANAEPNTYSIAFDKNLSYASGSMENLSMTYDVSTNLTENAFSAVGFTFKGWATSSTGEVAYEDCESVSNLTTTNGGIVTLYAVWEVSDITFTFDANGGTCSTTSKTVKYGRNVSGLPTPTKEGYVFDGWYAEFDGVDDFINLGRVYMGTSVFSIHFSAYSSNWADVADQRLISCTETGGWNIEGNNGKIQFAGYDSGVGYKATSSMYWADLDSGWHDFDLIFNGSVLRGFVDRVNIATSEEFSSGKIGYNETNSIMLGAEPSDSATEPYGNYFKGCIKNVVIQRTATLFSATNVTTWIVPAHDVTLHAMWTPIYKITLDNQSADVDGTTEIYEKYKSGWYSDDSATTRITSITIPTRNGYTFAGYYTGTAGSGTQIINSSGSIITSPKLFSTNKTIYANWTANTYAIIVVDGTIGSDEYSTSTSSQTRTLAVNSKTGYTFTGWSVEWTESTGYGGTIPTAITSTLTIPANTYGNIIITAQYSINSYTVTLNKGIGISGVSGAGTYTYGSSVTISATVATGYSWSVWTYGTTSTAKTRDQEFIFKMGDSDVFLTANATANVYTILLDGQSATTMTELGVYEKYATGWYSDSGATTKITSITAPSKDGYTFGGYYTETNGSGTQIIGASGTILAGNTYFTSSTTIYAKWTAITYTITVSGGTINNNKYSISTSSQTRTLAVNSKTGYTFTGWTVSWTDSTGYGGTKPTAINSTLTISANTYGNITVTAQHSVNSYTIKFNGNKPSLASCSVSGSMSDLAMTYNVAKNLTTNGFSLNGYTFQNWNTKSDGTGTTYSDGQSVSNLTATNGETVNLYAIWKENVIKLTLNKNGGSGGTDYVYYRYGINKFFKDSSCTTEFPTNSSGLQTYEIPAKKGHTFIKYTGDGTSGGGEGERYLYGNEEGYTPGIFASDLCTDIYADATLTAIWSANVYKITLDNQSATIAGTTEIYVKYGITWYSDSGLTTAINKITVPEKTGYIFKGYSTSGGLRYVGADGTLYSQSVNILENTTIYAEWVKAITITFDPNGGTCAETSKIFEYGTTINTLPTATKSGQTFDGWYAEFTGTASDAINFGREYMFTDKISIHFEAYSENWADIEGRRMISCTETGGWNIESNSGKINFCAYDSGVGYVNKVSDIYWSSLSVGWHTFDMIFDGTYLYGYIDGTRIATSSAFTSGKIGYYQEKEANGNYKYNSIFVGAEAGTSETEPTTVNADYFIGKIGNVVIQHSSERYTSSSVTTWTVPNQNVTLHALWSSTFTFDANDGTCSPISKKDKYVSTDSNLPTPTKSGYEFSGWYAEFTGTASDAINFGRAYMFTDKISIHLEAYSDNWASVVNQRLISCTETGGWNIECLDATVGTINFCAYDSGVGYKNATSSIKWADLSDGWHTFDMIFDGTYLYGYLDGGEDPIVTSSAFTSGQIGYNTTNSIFIGAEPSSDPNVPYNLYFNGKIGNVVIQHSSERYTSSSVTTWTVPNQNVTLHALWPSAVNTIELDTIYCNVQTIGGRPSTIGTTIIYERYGVGFYSSGKERMISIICPSYSGYIFNGYYTGENGTGTKIIDANGKILVNNSYFTSDTTLYASWTRNSIKITLNNNGGTGDILEVNIQSNGVFCLEGSTISYKVDSMAGYTPTKKDGSTFKGYYCSDIKNGAKKGIIYITADGQFTNDIFDLYGDITLTAYWGSINVVKIQLIDDPYSIVTAKKYIYEKYGYGWFSDANATISISNITKPTDSGYTFGGYWTCEGGSGIQIIDNSGNIKNTYTISSANFNTYNYFVVNASIYAYWISNVYTITLNNRSATESGTKVIYEKYGDGFYLRNLGVKTKRIFSPEKTGYSFGGYYTHTGGSGDQIIDSNGNIISSVSKFSSDTTIYAYWIIIENKIELCNIYGERNGVYVRGDEWIYQQPGVGWFYNSSDGHYQITKINIPKRLNYFFDGYYTDSGGKGTQIINSDGEIIASNTKNISNSIVYVNWLPYKIDGTYVYFGSFPQWVKDDSVKIISDSNSNWNNYCLGDDGCLYEKVENHAHLDGTEIFKNGSRYNMSHEPYYFKVEPLKWRILESSGGQALLFCEDIINAMAFDSNYGQYDGSDIYNYLNGNFRDKAFYEPDISNIKDLIRANVVDNYVFLLSKEDLENKSYGFSDIDDYRVRSKYVTDYAIINGSTPDYDSTYGGVGYYWTRTANKNDAYIVDINGTLYIGGYSSKDKSHIGVVPALWLNIGSGTSSFASSSGNEKTMSESVFEKVSKSDPLNLSSMMTLMSVLSVKTISGHTSGDTCKDLFFEEKRRRKYLKCVSKKK